MFREQPINDFGIDAQVEPFTAEGPSGRLLALQIKAGQSYFKEKVAGGIIYRGENSHLEYWNRHCLPVLIILYDATVGRAYWEAITSDTVTSTGKGWKVLVPYSHVVDAGCAKEWHSVSAGSPYAQRLRALVLAKPWMAILLEGRRLILEIDEWINKSSGCGSMKLVSRSDSGEDEVREEWPLLTFPGQLYQHLLPTLFPWADFGIDEDFYEEYDRAAFDADCGVWDGDEHVYIGHTEDFPEWRARQASIRPYTVASGEVARFRLELTISSLGNAFRALDDYLDSGKVSVPQANLRMSREYAVGLKALARRYRIYDDESGS